MFFTKPLWTGACSVYPTTKALKKEFTYTSRFGEEYSTYREKGGNIYVPRACCPMGVDKRSMGMPVEFSPAILGARNDEQKRLLRESEALFAKDESHILQAATGSGKTFLGVTLAQRLGVKTLIVVPKQDIMFQWRDACKKFLGLTDADIGYIQQDNCNVAGKKIVIGMVHSLAKDKYPASIKNEFGLTIYDECVSGAAQVPTSVGDLRLDTLVTKLLGGETIQALSWEASTSTFVYRPITAAYPQGLRETLVLSIDGCEDLVVTPDHKVLLTDGQWVEARNLVAGDDIVTNSI